MTPRSFSRLAAITVVAAVAFFLVFEWRAHTADDKPQEKEKAKRLPWVTSKVTGSPEPPPKYKSLRVFPSAKFHHPLLIARCPGSERLFIGEQEGILYSLANKADAKPDVFLDLKKEYKSLVPHDNAKGVNEVYGLVFHPNFEKNRYCYVCYVLQKKNAKPDYLPDGSRVSRFKVTDTDPPRIDPKSEEVLLTFQGGGHNGGDLHFGKDGLLYISTGDGSDPNPPDRLNTGQDCSDLLSSVLRIDVDQKNAGKNYAVPKDNPFVGMKDVRAEIWAFGFRNPWRMSFDRKTGDLWVGDVGWEQWEMVYKVEKGGNYGWSINEGRNPVKPDQKIGPTAIRPPAIELPHSIACSVNGGYVYRGKKFPELEGAYIFGDWETRRIWAARFDGEKLKEMPEIVKPNIRTTAFGEDNAGELYFCDYDTGFLYTLERNDAGAANNKFPTKLSDTGLFKNVKTHEMAEGVIPFEPNARMWHDSAWADYFLALPGQSSVKLFEEPRPLPGQVFWHNFSMQFPTDAVLVKTLSIGLVGKPGKPRIETQLLHFDGEDWHGYSYAWRDDQSDADLVSAEGAEKDLKVAYGGKERAQVWTFHSRAQCATCHNSWSEYTLAFNPRQLNNAKTHGNKNPSVLVAMTTAGIIQRIGKDDKPLPPFDEATALKRPDVAGPKNPGYTNAERARGYLHVNCAHCHRFGGGGGQVVLELDYSRPLKETGIFDVKPKQGDFDIPDARIVAPGDPYSSVLFYRMTKFSRGRMPHIGSEWPDFGGLVLIFSWIGELAEKPKPIPMVFEVEEIGKQLGSFKTAMPYAYSLGSGLFDEPDRAKLLAAVEKLKPGPIRELFEGYLPLDPKGRKLGANPRPASILALKGDAAKGEAIFFNKEIKCANCHKIGDRGTTLGPDLSAIGKSRTRAELLDSLLNPSARIEPQFAVYNVKTKDEKTYTGIVAKRDEKQLILRDAENKEIVIAGDNVESSRPSRVSLMPDGQMSAFTPQEAADLLEFLTQRK